MRLYNLLFIGLIVSAVSCADTKYLASKMKSSEIRELEFFKPISSIAYVERENLATIDDDLSSQSGKLISQQVFNYSSQIPRLNPVIITDANIQADLEAEVITACRASSAYNSIEVIPIPPTIDALLEARGKRFALLTYYSGYKRSPESYAWSKRRAAANNLLNFMPVTSSPMFITIENSYSSRAVLYAMIVDAQTNKIVFFNEFITKGEDPVSSEVISNELNKIFLDYFRR